jgi:hypothetical protein
MDKLELAAYVVQYLDIPSVVKAAHKLLQDYRTQELQVRWENLVQRLEQVEVQQTQASPVLWPELEQARWGLIHQLNQLSDQIRLLELNYPLPVRTVLDGRDDDVQLQRPSSIFWEHHEDLSGLKAISFARGTALREAHDKSIVGCYDTHAFAANATLESVSVMNAKTSGEDHINGISHVLLRL